MHPTTSVLSNLIRTGGPQVTKFVNKTGDTKYYYFKGNPYKLTGSLSQRIFRHCVLCGDNRFADNEWDRISKIWGRRIMVCGKETCQKDLEYLPGFVPERFYFLPSGQKTVEEVRELSRKGIFPIEHLESFFNEERFLHCVNKVTKLIRDDRVFPQESEIPAKYRDTIKRLEKFPVQTRLPYIDSVYFSYKEENDVEIGEYMSDTSDPFLRYLAEYRKKHVEILKKPRREQYFVDEKNDLMVVTYT